MDLNEINNQLLYLEETKTQIKTAINNKGQSISDSDTFRSYVDKINNISTLTSETADANVVSNDIASGKIAYANGQKVVGNLVEKSSDNVEQTTNVELNETGNLQFNSSIITNDNEFIARTGYNSSLYASSDIIAPIIGLTSEKIVAGNTILNVVGTAETGGIDTSDATATNEDIASGKTAYVNGRKITGIINTSLSGETEEFNSYNQDSIVNENGNLSMISSFILDHLFREGSSIKISLSENYAANAINLSADKIKQGETILGIAGTVEELNGQTKVVTPSTSENIVQPDEGYNALTSITVSAVDSSIDNNIIAANIKKDVTILGVTGILDVGIDTSDADALAEDIVIGKTAYVKDEKITGTLNIISSPSELISGALVSMDTENEKLVLSTTNNTKQVIDSNVMMRFNAPYNDVANAIGLTANKLLSGNTILGIEGTASTGITPDITISADNYGIEIVTSGEIDSTNGYKFYTDANTQSKLYEVGSKVETHISNTNLANILNITDNIIKKDVTICGVTGTYEGDNVIEQVESIDDLVNATELGKLAIIVDNKGVYGGTYQTRYVVTDLAQVVDTQQESLSIGTNVVKLIRTSYAPLDTIKDINEDKLFFTNSTGSIWYGAKYDNTNVENPVIRIQLIDNGNTYQIGYYDYTQSKWNQEIDEDIILSEICTISELNTENLSIMNNEFTYGVVGNDDMEMKWVELAAPGTITSAEYNTAIETSKNILGVTE